MKNQDIVKHIAYTNLLSHFLKTCQALDAQYYGGKGFFSVAANRTVGPSHRANVGIDQALNEIFELSYFVTAIQPALSKMLTEPSQAVK